MMNNNLITAIGTAIIGILIAYFTCNLFIGEIEDVTVKTIEPIGTDLSEPSPEVFNYKSLNPTVEVYVGNCNEYDEDGRCLDVDAEDEIIDLELEADSNPTPSDQSNQGDE